MAYVAYAAILPSAAVSTSKGTHVHLVEEDNTHNLAEFLKMVRPSVTNISIFLGELFSEEGLRKPSKELVDKLVNL